MKKILLVFAAAAVLLIAAFFLYRPLRTADTLAVYGGTVIDASGSAPQQESVILIRDGLIADIGSRETVKVPPDLVEKGRVLDNYYVPTRYPNGHPSGAPFEHYGPLQSGDAIQYAGEIVEFVRLQMAG